MANSKQNNKKNAGMPGDMTKKASSGSGKGRPARKSTYTLDELREERDIWYKICVLVHDLRNMTKDKTCENRTLQTTDAIYISAPYFSDDEAAVVKSAVTSTGSTIEQEISTNLETFFDKRQASEDYRPCGPHTLAPVYMSCFGIDKSEIEDEKFISRLRRSGLGGM
jgi:hypothetical protein